MNDEQEKEAARQAYQLKCFIENFNPIAHAEMCKVLSVHHKIKFDAYMAAGFTEEQSLKLCIL